MADMMQNPEEKQQPQSQPQGQIEGLPPDAVPIEGLPPDAVPMGQQSQAQPQGQTQGEPTQPQKQMTFKDFVSGALKTKEDAENELGTGFVKGMGNTVHGVGKLIHGAVGMVSPKAAEALVPEQGSKALDNMTTPEGTLQKVGFGAETLTEFLLGDEALKGLSLAERMANSAKVMQLLEKSPRLLQALKMGANVSKAQELLGPEERALLQSHPVLARLVSHGMDAIRQGVVQGVQTTAKTGDVAQGAKEGATMGAVSAAIGAPLSIAGGMLAKGGAAAKTVQNVSKLAEDAPDKTDVAELGSNFVNQAENKMHTDFQSGIDKIKNLIGDQQVPLKGSPFQKAAQNILETGESVHPLDKLAADTAPVSDKAKHYIKGVASALEKAEPEAEDIKSSILDATGKPMSRGNAATAAKAEPEPVNIGIDDLIRARQRMSERMRELGFDSTADRADRKAYSTMIDGIDDTIESLSRQANPGDHTRYMKDAIQSIAPGKQLGDLTTQELSQVAQKAAEIQRTTSPSGLYEQIRSQYRTTKKLFDDPEARRAIQSIKTGNLDDIGRQLTVGTKSGHVIDVLRQLVGPENMNNLSDQIFQTWVKDASTIADKEGNVVASQFDPDKLLRKWVSLKPNVRESLFQMTPERAKSYSDFVTQVSDAASFKKLVKYGLLPATLGTAGVVHGPLAAFFGAVAGAGSELAFGRARDILDSIANNPRTWNIVAKAASASGSKVADFATTMSKLGASKTVSSLGGLSETAKAGKEKVNQKVKDEIDKTKKDVSPLRRIFHGASAPLANPGGFNPSTPPADEMPVTTAQQAQ